ncbi:MAG: hypothetical protein U0905_01385 [Pirellulales bacterium]
MKGFPGYLVEVVTQDSLRLHGFYQRPLEPSGELWVLVHGVASNFYSASLLNHLAESILNSGRSVLPDQHAWTRSDEFSIGWFGGSPRWSCV